MFALGVLSDKNETEWHEVSECGEKLRDVTKMLVSVCLLKKKIVQISISFFFQGCNVKKKSMISRGAGDERCQPTPRKSAACVMYRRLRVCECVCVCVCVCVFWECVLMADFYCCHWWNRAVWENIFVKWTEVIAVGTSHWLRRTEWDGATKWKVGEHIDIPHTTPPPTPHTHTPHTHTNSHPHTHTHTHTPTHTTCTLIHHPPHTHTNKHPHTCIHHIHHLPKLHLPTHTHIYLHTLHERSGRQKKISFVLCFARTILVGWWGSGPNYCSSQLILDL